MTGCGATIATGAGAVTTAGVVDGALAPVVVVDGG